MITSHDRLKVPNRRRRALLVAPAAAAGLAALAAGQVVPTALVGRAG